MPNQSQGVISPPPPAVPKTVVVERVVEKAQAPQVERRRFAPSAPITNADDILSRILRLELMIESLAASIPAGLVQDMSVLKARVASIEQQEDALEPVVPRDLDWNGLVRLGGKLFDLTASTPLKWIKVDWANGAVEYTDTDPTDPFPAGTEYYLTSEQTGTIHVIR